MGGSLQGGKEPRGREGTEKEEGGRKSKRKTGGTRRKMKNFTINMQLYYYL